MSKMLALVVWQLRYTWKAWVGSLVVLTAAGLVLGFTLIGAVSTISVHLDHGNFNPVDFFAMPAVFGLITLVLVISGVIRLLIDKFKDDYRLWAILGAKPNQLALLIGGQMSLAGMVGGCLGYFLSLPMVDKYYAWVITTRGMREFPAINMKLQLSSLILTILLLGTFTGVIGFINGKRTFTNGHQRRCLTKKRKFGLSLIGWFWCVITCGSLSYVYSLFYQKPKYLLMLFGSQSLEDTYSQALLGLIITMIIATHASERLILPVLVKALAVVFPATIIKTFKIAYWHVLRKTDFLRSVTMPLFIFSLVSSYFMYMIVDLANVANKRNLSEIIGTLILFLGAPFLIILANTISLTIISRPERTASSRQLQIIGLSLKDLLHEKGVEAGIYGLIVFIQGVIGNALLFIPILKASDYTQTQMYDSWWSIVEWPAATGIMVFLFILIVDGSYIYKISVSNSQ
ncbi:hypothetical protein [Lactiplantibacillus dongliensis]|nr:hypothetical protein [Lactiplantibacillus dongliensis]